jgi:hypothetical protein
MGVTIREENKVKLFESRMLWRDEMVGVWRKMHTEELHDLCFSPDITVIRSRRMGWTGQ